MLLYVVYTTAVTAIGHEGVLYVTEGFAKARSWPENPVKSIQNGIKKAYSAVGEGSGCFFF